MDVAGALESLQAHIAALRPAQIRCDIRFQGLLSSAPSVNGSADGTTVHGWRKLRPLHGLRCRDACVMGTVTTSGGGGAWQQRRVCQTRQASGAGLITKGISLLFDRDRLLWRHSGSILMFTWQGDFLCGLLCFLQTNLKDFREPAAANEFVRPHPIVRRLRAEARNCGTPAPGSKGTVRQQACAAPIRSPPERIPAPPAEQFTGLWLSSRAAFRTVPQDAVPEDTGTAPASTFIGGGGKGATNKRAAAGVGTTAGV